MVHVRNENAVETCGELAEQFKMLHHEVGAHDGEARVDAERRHGRVERYCFDEVAERSWPKRKRVAAR